LPAFRAGRLAAAANVTTDVDERAADTRHRSCGRKRAVDDPAFRDAIQRKLNGSRTCNGSSRRVQLDVSSRRCLRKLSKQVA
jgi:hypothetical protein